MEVNVTRQLRIIRLRYCYFYVGSERKFQLVEIANESDYLGKQR